MLTIINKFENTITVTATLKERHINYQRDGYWGGEGWREKGEEEVEGEGEKQQWD